MHTKVQWTNDRVYQELILITYISSKKKILSPYHLWEVFKIKTLLSYVLPSSHRTNDVELRSPKIEFLAYLECLLLEHLLI